MRPQTVWPYGSGGIKRAAENEGRQEVLQCPLGPLPGHQQIMLKVFTRQTSHH